MTDTMDAGRSGSSASRSKPRSYEATADPLDPGTRALVRTRATRGGRSHVGPTRPRHEHHPTRGRRGPVTHSHVDSHVERTGWTWYDRMERVLRLLAGRCAPIPPPWGRAVVSRRRRCYTEADGESATSVNPVADTPGEAARGAWPSVGLAAFAAQAPTEVATTTAMIACAATDGYRVYGASVCSVLGRPQSGSTYLSELERRVVTPLPSAFMTRRELTPGSRCV